MKRSIIIIFCVACSFHLFAQNESEKGEVMMKLLLLKTALVAKDSVTLSKVLADDVTYGHTNGLIQSKAELIHSVMTGEQDYKSIDPTTMNIRIFDKTAVVNMDSKVVLNYNKQSMQIDMKITFVWIKKNNDWQLEARQAVKNN
jgi:hypothetical protein